MKLTVERVISDDDATVSHIFLDGEFQCFGLEDEYRENKLPEETRIPAGRYKIGVRKTGGFHKRYSKRFPDMHEGMLHVRKVPGFEFILIHVGNTDKDTAGCLLVGSSAVTTPGDLKVTSSTDAYKRLYPKVIKAAKAGELEIEYIDRDRGVASS